MTLVPLLILCVSLLCATMTIILLMRSRSIFINTNEITNTITTISSRMDMIMQSISSLQTSINTSATQLENSITQTVSQNIQSILLGQQNGLDVLSKQIVQMTTGNENKMENLRSIVEQKLTSIQKDSEEKLEKIRLTVEEKLHDTLEKRLGHSFKIVSDRLEMVYQGLGEMRNLATGVGDLKKVLTNVKTRGILGEVQLGNILEQFLIPEQYSENVAIKQGSQDRVEFAVNLPGKDIQQQKLLLPIDAKFPLANYQRLVDAQERCDKETIDIESKALESTIKKSAKTIADKYIHPPITSDFALMFLPIEGLYAEILRKPGLIENIQKEYKVIITGPTTLSAIISSLQMGFRTLAIEKRSSEVWRVLDVVRREFLKFADLLSKTRTKLEQAGSVIGDAENRSRLLKNKLDNFENKYNISEEVTHKTNSTPPNLLDDQ